MGAYLIWGVLPFYLRLLQGVPAADVLAHRILWTVLVVVVLISGLKGWERVRAALRQPRLLLMLLASAVCITINWGVYTWAILAGHAIDTSLGYFINPLVSVLFGVVLLGERLGRLQLVAVGLAALGVAVLTIERGSLPLVSLALALSFGVYGLIRKQAAVDTATGLFVETLLLAPMAALWVAQTPQGFAGWPLMTTATLALGGLATAIPLLLFGLAAPASGATRATALNPRHGQDRHPRGPPPEGPHPDFRRQERCAHADAVCAAHRRAADPAQPAAAGRYRYVRPPSQQSRPVDHH